MDLGMMIVIAIIIGIIGGFIGAGILKGQLYSVHRQSAAANYIRKDSFVLTDNKDRFLYKKEHKCQRLYFVGSVVAHVPLFYSRRYQERRCLQ